MFYEPYKSHELACYSAIFHIIVIMYTVDDRQTAKISDRFIAAVITGFFGFFAGWFFAIAGEKFLGNDYGLCLITAVGFGIFAFMAPSKSREVWASICESVGRIIARL